LDPVRIPRHPARILPRLPGSAGGRQHARARKQRPGERGGPSDARNRRPLGRGGEQLEQAGTLAAVGAQGPRIAAATTRCPGGGGRGESVTGVRTIRSSQTATGSCQTPRLTFSYNPTDSIRHTGHSAFAPRGRPITVTTRTPKPHAPHTRPFPQRAPRPR